MQTKNILLFSTAGTFTPNNSAMAFWVSQKVPS